MKMSMFMLAHYLQPYHPECHIENDSCCIRGIRFLTDRNPERSTDYIYLGNAGAFFQDPRFQEAMILANGHNQIICHSVDGEELLNDVLCAFDHYSSLQLSLHEKAARHAPLAEMLSEAASVFTGPVFLFDLEGNVVESIHTEQYSNIEMNAVLDNVGRIRNLGTGTIANTFVDRSGRISHDLTGSPQLLHIQGTDDQECICLYLRQEEENIGFMLYFPVTENETQCGMQLAGEWTGYFSEAEEFTSATSVRQSGHEILRKLLAGEQVPAAVASRLRLRLRPDRNISLILFESHAIRNYTFRKMLANDIEQLPIPCIAGENGGQTAVLLAPEDIPEVLRFINRRIPKENTSLGISMTVYDLRDIGIAYEQALFALNYSEKPDVRYCRDLAPAFLLRGIREKEQTSHLLHPAIRILKAYDRQEKTELTETLRAYAETGWHQADTASVLHIHLNTLKYRLKRIAELTGVSFHDPSENFYLQLSIRLDMPDTEQGGEK